MSPGQAYPGLAEYMGMELSEAIIRDNMPEYLTNNQVAISHMIKICPNSSFLGIYKTVASNMIPCRIVRV